MKCIWCKKDDQEPSIEHIIPEALGCPEGFVLTGGIVCRACNNGLASLDRAVIDDFDFPAFLAGIPRKGGRSPAIMNRGNVKGTFGRKGPEISFNMDKHPVQAHDGTVLPPVGGSNRHIRASFERRGMMGKVSFSAEIGRNPKFVRGIVKIAFSSAAYFLGPEIVMSDEFDNIRNFVINGRGNRKIIMLMGDCDSYYNHASPPFVNDTGDYTVRFRLAYIDFLVDMSRDLSMFPVLREKMLELHGKTGWTYLPLDGPPHNRAKKRRR
ncbi:hypothetical protein M2352_003497 [Azospirillum fermentarium]|uniref:HNH endonuclease n=1 Tax=Azospirillum fermentarium TaxID=1233114 RepID=UPI0022279EBB|nr:HNH endonuclease [Azospirillum fermentarium]MCW2247863.1 hypothetical protein [Azospirillum fermentarium]